MSRLFPFVFLCLLAAACKDKDKPKNEGADDAQFFDVLGLLRSQVAHVDTSLYRIIKVETVNNVSDTVYLRREEFKNYAAEFTSLPDISSADLKDGYSSAKMVDTLLERIVYSYTATDEDAEIRREDLTIDPRFGGGNSEVKTVFIHQIKDSGDSTIDKKMLWEIDKRFFVMTRIVNEDGSEKIKKLEVKWQGHPSAN
jgi:hypothetical protein